MSAQDEAPISMSTVSVRDDFQVHVTEKYTPMARPNRGRAWQSHDVTKDTSSFQPVVVLSLQVFLDQFNNVDINHT